MLNLFVLVLVDQGDVIPNADYLTISRYDRYFSVLLELVYENCEIHS